MPDSGLIFAIETSCDETAAAVVERGLRPLSSVVSSQIAIHAPHGGVVPELAARHHLENLLPVIEAAEQEAGVKIQDCDAIAVTLGPGLIGCLLLGVEAGKSLAVLHDKPLIAVNHLAAHLYSPMMEVEGQIRIGEGDFEYPQIGLLVSGGHTELILVKGPLEWEALGQTLDDAAGEAYDKVAKLLGLGYPGGPAIDKRAPLGDPKAFQFPRPMRDRSGYDFSFSGLKTAVRVKVEKLGGPDAITGDEKLLNDLCASFQAAVIDSLLTKAQRAMHDKHIARLIIGGGVAANRGLRAEAERRLSGAQIAIPPMSLCTDNAAMIGGLAWHQFLAGDTADLSASARPQWPLRNGQ